MTNSAFFESRRTGIGGSDVAAILGVHPFKTAFEVWDEKVNGTCKDLSNNVSVLYGNLLERPLIEHYLNKYQAEFQGVKLKLPTLRHSKYPYLIANVDGIVKPLIGEDFVLEIKTAAARNVIRWGESNSQTVPEEYLCQVTHYMTVSSLREARIKVAFLSDGIKSCLSWMLLQEKLIPDYELKFDELLECVEMRYYTFSYDEELANLIMERCHQFWNEHVQTKEPPEKHYTCVNFQEYVKNKFKTVDAGVKVSLSGIELEELRCQYLDLKGRAHELLKNIRSNKEALKAVETEFLDKIGNAERGVFKEGDGFIRTLKFRSGFTTKSKHYIDFRYAKNMIDEENLEPHGSEECQTE